MPFTNMFIFLYSFFSLTVLAYLSTKAISLALEQFKRLNDV